CVFHDPAPAETSTLSLHDALPIYLFRVRGSGPTSVDRRDDRNEVRVHKARAPVSQRPQRSELVMLATHAVDRGLLPLSIEANRRSEEHTSELQSREKSRMPSSA